MTNRCAICSKKLTLTDFECGKCKTRFCALHRLPEEHKCAHDFHAEWQARLKTQLERVVASKVDKI
jgi:predicted nucleic acid binding AN1-type Zn finger protein